MILNLRNSLQILLLVCSLATFAQEDLKDTLWFDKDWKGSLRSDAAFYRIYEKKTNGFVVHDKYLSGETQMIAEASAVKPELIKEGKTVYFYKNGIRQKRGSYINNKKTGDWIYYFDREKDSSVTRYKEDGTEEQLRKSKHEEIYTIVETPAEFPGGISGMMQFIKENTSYPENCRSLALGGKTFLKFVVDENGDIMNAEVIRSSGVTELDNEALRVLHLMPKWKPAQMTGKSVKCYFNLPFSFAISTPFFLCNVNNKNEDYLLAWQAVLSNNTDRALELYSKNSESMEAWYNIGVIHFYKKNKKEAKKYFEMVKSTADPKSQYYVLADKFLKNEF